MVAVASVPILINVSAPPPPAVAWLAGVPLFDWRQIPNSQMLVQGAGLDPIYMDPIYAGTTQGPIRSGNVGSHVINQPPNKYGQDNDIQYDIYNYYNIHQSYNSMAHETGLHSGRPSALYTGNGDTHWPDNSVPRFVFGADAPFWDIAIRGTSALNYKNGDFRVAPAFPREFILSANILGKTTYSIGERVCTLTEDLRVRFPFEKLFKIYIVIGVAGGSPQLAAVKPTYPGVVNEIVVDGNYTLQEESNPVQRNTNYKIGTRISVVIASGPQAGQRHSYIMAEQNGPPPGPQWQGTTAASAPVFMGEIQEYVIDGTCIWQEGYFYGHPDVPPQAGESTHPYRHYDGSPKGGHGYSQYWIVERDMLFVRVGPTANNYPLDTGGAIDESSVGHLDTATWDLSDPTIFPSQRTTSAGKAVTYGEPTDLRKCQHLLTEEIWEIFDRHLIRRRRVGPLQYVAELMYVMPSGTLYNSCFAIDYEHNLLLGCSMVAAQRQWWTFPTTAAAVGQPGAVANRTILTITGPAAGILGSPLLDRPREGETMTYTPGPHLGPNGAWVWLANNYSSHVVADKIFKLELQGTNLVATQVPCAGFPSYQASGSSTNPTNKFRYDPALKILFYYTAECNPVKYCRVG